MQEIITKNAPGAIGVYSQAIKHNETVYMSGQFPFNPQTMELCSTNISEQIKQTFLNLEALCKASDGSLANIVKLTIYLLDLNNFTLVNEAMLKFFKKPYPARAVLGVNELPKKSQIEIDAIMTLYS